jgi:FixJ family two-component response regulator
MALTQSRKVKVHTLDRRIGGQSRDGIWLLDDDVSMLKALGRLMRSAGLIAEKFSKPDAFLANLKHAPCRVAILDVWMPQMKGLEVQARLRRDSPETRIIFLTGRDDPLVRQTALDAGAVAFLVKPFDDENLVRLVREAQGSRRNQRPFKAGQKEAWNSETGSMCSVAEGYSDRRAKGKQGGSLP